MFRRSAFLMGQTEAHQLNLIFRTCGHPTEKTWPNIHKRCPLWEKGIKPHPGQQQFPIKLAESLRSKLPNPKWMTDKAVNMISKLLELNPERRWSAKQSLDADYLFENPIVKPAEELPMKFAVTSAHEMECRKKHQKKNFQNQAKVKATYEADFRQQIARDARPK
jgi:serine/threonine protein kinase